MFEIIVVDPVVVVVAVDNLDLSRFEFATCSETDDVAGV